MNDGAGTAHAWIDMGSTTSWTRAAAFAGDMSALAPQIATASREELNFGVTLTAGRGGGWEGQELLVEAVGRVGDVEADAPSVMQSFRPETDASAAAI